LEVATVEDSPVPEMKRGFSERNPNKFKS